MSAIIYKILEKAGLVRKSTCDYWRNEYRAIFKQNVELALDNKLLKSERDRLQRRVKKLTKSN